MNALILAAGKGSRLGDITRETPKPLLEVGGKPILQRHLEMCAAAGCREVCINTHYLGEKIREFAGDGSRFGLRITYSYEPELLGTAGALANFRGLLEKDDFLVVYGDNLIELDPAALARVHREKGALMTVALHYREDVSMSGMVVLDDSGRIVQFIEKPAKALQVSHLVNAGVYVVSPKVFSWLPPGAPDFGRDIIPSLIAAGEPVFGMVIDTEVIAVDTPELLEKARSARS